MIYPFIRNNMINKSTAMLVPIHDLNTTVITEIAKNMRVVPTATAIILISASFKIIYKFNLYTELLPFFYWK